MNYHQAHLQQYKLRQKTLQKSKIKKQQRAQAQHMQQAQLLAQQRQVPPLVQQPPPPVQAQVLLPPLHLQPQVIQAEETPPRPEEQEPWVPPPLPPKPPGHHRNIINFQDRRQKFASCSQLFSNIHSLSESFQQDLALHPDTYQEMFPDRARFSPVITQSCPDIPVSAITQAAAPLDLIHSNSQQTLFTPILPATSQTAESSPATANTVSEYPESVQLETSSDSDIFTTPTKEESESSSGPTTPTNTIPPPVPLLPDKTKGIESKFQKLAAGTTVLAKAIVRNQKPPPRPPKQLEPQEPPELPPRYALGRTPKSGDLGDYCPLCTESSDLKNWQKSGNLKHSANCSNNKPLPPDPAPANPAPAERPVTRNRGKPTGKYGPYSQKFTPFKK